ncbi:MAG: histidine--tRNA ligase [Anaerolinea sp.]|nr:histidine--tRNA ligase [Anaerolinea sp.]
MTTRYQAPRGTQDVLPEMQPYWQAVLDQAREVARLHGYHRLDTPMFEQAGVFEKGSGDTTDIVEKEMYTFTDRGEEHLALTPEWTPASCRAYLEHGMASWPQPVRLWTTHPMFRYDRPQKGRYRQHTQFGCEVIGSEDALVDAEVIGILWALYGRLGIRDVVVRLGSIDDHGPRRDYVQRLQDYYRPHLEKLSEDSKRRFERNPLRLLDSKDERDQPFKDAAPKLVDMLSPGAQAHHETVMAALQSAGIAFEIDPLLVRGLDYYNRTVFEIVPTEDERAQSTIGGGGRYDGLIEILGGPPTPGIGFGSGIERIILEMQKNGVSFDAAASADVYIVHRAEGSQPVAFRMAAELRKRGLSTVIGESGRSFKAQMRAANASGAQQAIIIGDDEMASGTAVLKPLRGDAEQRKVPFERVAGELGAGA